MLRQHGVTAAVSTACCGACAVSDHAAECGRSLSEGKHDSAIDTLKAPKTCCACLCFLLPGLPVVQRSVSSVTKRSQKSKRRSCTGARVTEILSPLRPYHVWRHSSGKELGGPMNHKRKPGRNTNVAAPNIQDAMSDSDDEFAEVSHVANSPLSSLWAWAAAQSWLTLPYTSLSPVTGPNTQTWCFNSFHLLLQPVCLPVVMCPASAVCQAPKTCAPPATNAVCADRSAPPLPHAASYRTTASTARVHTQTDVPRRPQQVGCAHALPLDMLCQGRPSSHAHEKLLRSMFTQIHSYTTSTGDDAFLL